MEREIKFRGIYTDIEEKKKWVYGDLVHGKKITQTGLEDKVSVGGYPVDANTVGQYTGMKDINSKEMFEGDIVRGMEIDCHNCPQVRLEKCDNTKCVKKEAYRDVVSLDRTRFWLENETFGWDGEELLDSEIAEIIGNKFDNPELLKP